MDIDLYKSVVAFVRKTNKASISHIQRNFYLGYARASEIMDKLESEYVVSRMSASGRRDVYPEIVANLNAEIDDLKVKLAKLDRDADQLLTERDEMQEFAEKLKDRLQEVFNQDFGDHSNANCPFTNALEYDDSGFVLVPKEPTGKMISAGYESKEHVNNLIVNYKAMIEAAQGEGHDNIE